MDLYTFWWIQLRQEIREAIVLLYFLFFHANFMIINEILGVPVVLNKGQNLFIFRVIQDVQTPFKYALKINYRNKFTFIVQRHCEDIIFVFSSHPMTLLEKRSCGTYMGRFACRGCHVSFVVNHGRWSFSGSERLNTALGPLEADLEGKGNLTLENVCTRFPFSQTNRH